MSRRQIWSFGVFSLNQCHWGCVNVMFEFVQRCFFGLIQRCTTKGVILACYLSFKTQTPASLAFSCLILTNTCRVFFEDEFPRIQFKQDLFLTKQRVITASKLVLHSYPLFVFSLPFFHSEVERCWWRRMKLTKPVLCYQTSFEVPASTNSYLTIQNFSFSFFSFFFSFFFLSLQNRDLKAAQGHRRELF